MDLDRLAEFTAISRLGSIKLAARELGLSSATLSARLLKFEEQLGSPLFSRSPGGLKLTRAGEVLLPNALEILSSYDQLRQNVRAAQEHSYHQLRIAISGSSLPLHLGPFLDQLVLDNPNIRLEILDDSRFGIVEGLQSGQVDIYFAPVMEDFAPHGLVKVPIVAPSHYAVLPKNHPLADRAVISIRDLDQEQFILYPGTQEPAIREFQLRNLRDSGIRYTVYDSETSVVFYMLLVPIGKGVLLRPTYLIDLPPNSVSMPVSDLPHPATLCYFYSKSNPSPDARAFVRDYAQYIKEVSAREHSKDL